MLRKFWVRRGAKMLDRLRPGWEHEIVVERLNMNDAYDCILGQLYGYYWEGLANIGLNKGAYHGFDLHWGRCSERVYSKRNSQLTALWIAEINQRRN